MGREHYFSVHGPIRSSNCHGILAVTDTGKEHPVYLRHKHANHAGRSGSDLFRVDFGSQIR